MVRVPLHGAAIPQQLQRDQAFLPLNVWRTKPELVAGKFVFSVWLNMTKKRVIFDRSSYLTCCWSESPDVTGEVCH